MVPGTKSDIGFDRAPNGYVLRLTGTIGADAKPERLRVGIDDPARYAAWRFGEMLKARGVKVAGTIDVRHRVLISADDPASRGTAPPARPPAEAVLAKLVPPPLADDVVITNKVSQNLHAELFLRRVGLVNGSGSIADGQVAVRAMLAKAGVPRTAFDFSDGSGMSTYNRVAPRAAIGLLRWIANQPWGAAWRASLPVGGVDGTLARRLRRHDPRQKAVRQDRQPQRHLGAVGLHDRRERADFDILDLCQRHSRRRERDQGDGRRAGLDRGGKLKSRA